ncbi:MAG: DNA helicase UvrD [Omnitrophica WOR_2 bacterium GWF2_43_52]|nr:MAG: DNA helicase UvrD [Omnitrophica WOR_2 bacterium GWC2_44_8]OGX20410.1 MAG: DNA helicase UvrD [Omnitrophica WOR_2 bacterium GWF2_43_52]HAH20680.1 DNA helicase UvrD [Candidatus Omnitrophota bacterium]HBG62991.1 DNA helicase UvrD [Candidatus Omnitrophota bacterium]HCD38684.1 DNA helicase UvrD [Candidatus Omnitrophota bacterium]
MEFVADFHIHSKYSRATSKDMDVEHLAQWAKLKGIQLIGTGDFTHHLWLEELRGKLEDQGNGLYAYNGIHFMLTSEISCIYSKNNRGYRIHNVIFAPSFKTVEKINAYLAGIGNLASDGRPILGLDAAELARIIFDIDPNCFFVPGHIWTPWFSLFGSASGFDRIEDCFEEQAKNIHCLETGLSSDPAMNWRVSALDRFSLISNSDSHSPSKIGREANVFDCELSYNEIITALKTKDKKKFLYTIEFYPEEGKYHYDGHRLCGITFSPKESKAHKNICPKCKKPLTIGVMNRVDQLADRPEGFKPDNAIPFKNLIPLDEIIAEAKGMGKASQAVELEYRSIIAKFGTELDVLGKVPKEELLKGIDNRIADAIIRVREGRLHIAPGYDGEYGKISIFGDDEKPKKHEEQLSLF